MGYKVKKAFFGIGAVAIILFFISLFHFFLTKNQVNEKKEFGEKQSILRMTEVNEISTMDSMLNIDSAGNTALSMVFEGLYRRNKNNEPSPAVAKEAPVISNEGKTYTFSLRKEAKWSNGKPVRAQDFVFAWRRVVDPINASPNVSSLLGVIKNASSIFENQKHVEELGVKALDDNLLEIELENPSPYFLELLCGSEFFPQSEEVVINQRKKYGTTSKNMVFNGPFMMDSWEQLSSEWTYVSNPMYWDKSEVKLTQVEVSVIKETRTALDLYHANKLDVVKVSGEYIDTEKDNKELFIVPTSAVFYLMLNQQRSNNPTPLANEHIRKAIGYSLDKEVYCDEITQKLAFPAGGFVPKGLANNPLTGQDFRKENGVFLEYNRPLAKLEWEQGMKELGVKELNLDYVSDDTDTAKRTAEFMKGQLEDALSGLTLSIKNVPAKVRMQLYQDKEYDIQLNGSMSTLADPIPLLELFESTNVNNLLGIKNEEYDLLIKKSKEYGEEHKLIRWETLKQAEKILLDHAEIVPFYQANRAVLKKPKINWLGVPLIGPEYDLKYTKILK